MIIQTDQAQVGGRNQWVIITSDSRTSGGTTNIGLSVDLNGGWDEVLIELTLSAYSSAQSWLRFDGNDSESYSYRLIGNSISVSEDQDRFVLTDHSGESRSVYGYVRVDARDMGDTFGRRPTAICNLSGSSDSFSDVDVAQSGGFNLNIASFPQ